MDMLQDFFRTGLSTITDVLPIVAIIFGFQLLVLRQPVPNLKSVLIGFVYVLIGLTLFLVGLQEALFPIGRAMARQLIVGHDGLPVLTVHTCGPPEVGANRTMKVIESPGAKS